MENSMRQHHDAFHLNTLEVGTLMANEILAEFFRHNRWANVTLADACTALTDAILDATVTGTHGSIRQTLLHLAAAETRYVTLLIGADPPQPIHEQSGWPSIAGIRASLVWSGTHLIEIARVAAPAMLHGTRRGETYAIPNFVALIQSINHATDHRSQIATLLTQHGVTPPELDVWHYTPEIPVA